MMWGSSVRTSGSGGDDRGRRSAYDTSAGDGFGGDDGARGSGEGGGAGCCRCDACACCHRFDQLATGDSGGVKRGRAGRVTMIDAPCSAVDCSRGRLNVVSAGDERSFAFLGNIAALGGKWCESGWSRDCSSPYP